MTLIRKAELFREKHVPVPLCPQKISHGLTWYRNLAFRGERQESDRPNKWHDQLIGSVIEMECVFCAVRSAFTIHCIQIFVLNKCLCIYVHGRLFVYPDQMDIKATGVCQLTHLILHISFLLLCAEFAVSRANPLCCSARRLLLILFVTNFAYCTTKDNRCIHAATAYLTMLSVGQFV